MPVRIGAGVVEFLVDSGSAATVLSAAAFETAERDTRAVLRESKLNLCTASGQNLDIRGETTLELGIGDQTFRHSVVVGDIGNSAGILGTDFMQKYGCLLDLAQGTMQIGTQVVQLKREAVNTCARVQVCDTVIVPPRCEAFVKGSLLQASFGEKTDGLLEGLDTFKSETSLEVPRCLVHVTKNEVFVPVTNLSDREVTVKADTIIATVETAVSLNSLSQEREEKERLYSDQLPSHLESLATKLSPRVSEKTKGEVRDTLIEFQDVFMCPDTQLGRTGKVRHTIDTANSKPVKLPPRRLPMAQREVVDRELEKMLKEDIIEPSDSPWAANVVLVKKKDGSVRFCVDYRKLNECTKKDAYPLPHIGDSLDALSGSCWFSTLDLAQGFYQVEMDENDKQKTAFATHRGLFQFKVMPFGLCNSPATFERLMELVLSGVLFERCLVYIDDVICFGKTEEEALYNLRVVLQKFRDANLKLKPSKCSLFQDECTFLGHTVAREGTTCEKSKVEAVASWPVPTCVSEVRSFLGTASYYRKYIQGFADIASPLTNLTKKNQKFVWTEKCQNAFERLKEALVSAPVLAYPTREGKFVLDTDASATAIGAVLSQIQDGEEKVIAYASCALSSSRQNYCTTYRELYAVVRFVKYFSHYLWGRPFLVRSDHSSLKWLKNFKQPEGMVARWIATLDTYDFQIEHRKGASHGNADGLSRIPRRCCQREECRQCTQKQVRVVTRSQARGRDLADKGVASGTQRNADSCSHEEVPRVDPEVTSRGDATGKGKDVLVRADKAVQSNSASWSNEDAPESVQSFTFDPDVQGGSGATFLLDRKRVEQCVQTEAVTKGVGNSKSDCVPGVPKSSPCKSNWFSVWSHEELAGFQQKDPVTSTLLSLKSRGEKPPKTEISKYSTAIRTLIAQWDNLRVVDGLLYVVSEKSLTQEEVLLLVAPAGVRQKVLNMSHDAKTAGHLGRDRTLANVKRHVYWPGMADDVARWCRQCDMCARRKPGPGRAKLPMQHVNVGMPLERVAIDILGPLPMSHDGYEYIMVVEDYYTKYAEAYSLVDHTAQTVGDKLLTEFICRFGVPLTIHTDQGREFESRLFQHLCEALGADKTRTTPYHPQSDGMVERQNRTIQQMLSAYVNERRDDWSDHLDLIMMAYRSSVHQSTQCTPNLIMFGREVNLPLTVELGVFPTGDRSQCPVEYVEWVQNTLERVFRFVKLNTESRVYTNRNTIMIETARLER